MRYIIWLIIATLVTLIVIVVIGLFFLDDVKSFGIGIVAGLVIGLVTGFVTSTAVSLTLSIAQFSFSTAGYRVKKTVKATEEIFLSEPKSEERSSLRNKYRYSLGVIIDDLEQTFGEIDDFEKVKGWACFTDYDEVKHQLKGKDRWDWFNRYARPVIEDINSFSFIGRYDFRKEIRQLSALTELCNCLEKVVCELDAAFGTNLIELDDNNRVVPQPSTNLETEGIKSLKEEYHNLHTAWRKWLCIVEIGGLPKRLKRSQNIRS